ncbi:hypothetical protein [uncultured Porphyromonas sp.]|uniref:hypothetical protein n=1 Tax=uncultured Porphyromonas sp. TaxID=159274 RepID=UPI0026107265|nr:hypothetical protein [uncultured Porphyromonas sp.]
MSQIASIIRSLAGHPSSVLKVCEVTSLDRGTRTIDCQPLDETAPILGASLQADSGGTQGMTLYPKVGSLVIVGLVEGTPLGAVLLADELEELNVQIGDQQISITREGIILNEGKLGGIIKITDLTSKINTLEREFNTLKQVLTSWTPIPQDGGASLKASVASWAGRQLQLTRQSDYEDTKVKH